MILFLIFLLFSIPTPSYADDFDFNGNTLHSYFRHTITYTLGEQDSVGEEGWEIVFDESLLEGEYTENINSFSMHNITDLSNPDLQYKKRIPTLLGRVSGPPGTVIDVTFFYYNLTGHDVEIDRVIVPYSKDDATQGNLLDICSFEYLYPVWEEIPLLIGIKNRRRYGFFSRYTGPGIIPNGQEGMMLLERMEIGDPLEIVEMRYEEVGGEYAITFEIRNVSEEKLNNIELKHGSFATLFSLDAGELLLLEYTISSDEVSDGIKIINNSWRTECSNVGGALNNWADEKAITVFVERSGRIDAGAYLQPASEGFCVTRIPYSLLYEFPSIGKVEELPVEGLPLEQGEEDREGLILGVGDFSENIPVLPFTAMW